MCEEGALQHFVSPGGHRRIPSEAIAAVRTNGRSRSSTASLPSSVLQNRRERLEELGLDAQEIRAHRELDRLRAEQDDEAEWNAAQTRGRETERQCQLEQAKAERLRHERLKEQADADERRARLRQQVQLALNATLPADLPFEKQRALADALETEPLRANVEDEKTPVPRTSKKKPKISRRPCTGIRNLGGFQISSTTKTPRWAVERTTTTSSRTASATTTSF